jgi:hypothetical protein
VNFVKIAQDWLAAHRPVSPLRGISFERSVQAFYALYVLFVFPKTVVLCLILLQAGITLLRPKSRAIDAHGRLLPTNEAIDDSNTCDE